MTTKAIGSPVFTAFDQLGKPLAGGKVWTFEAGTTTPKATFQDANGSAAHTNPVILGVRGNATIFWGTGLYKVRVEDSAGVLQWEVDGFDPQVIDLPAPGEDLIDNGSFELDTDGDGVPDGWMVTTYTGGTVDTDRYDAGTNPSPDVLHGEAALRFVSPGGAGNGGGYADQADYFEVAEGEDLDVAFWIKASAAGVHNQVDVRWFTSAQAAHGTPQTTVYDEAAANPTGWTEMRYRVTPPSGARFAKVRLYGCIDDDATAGTTRYDRVTVQTVQPQYLRSDVADQVGGALSFTASPVLGNNIALRGTDTGGTARTLLDLNGLDQIRVGDINMPLVLYHNGLLVESSGGGSTIWTAFNDGAGSGLDADLLDGVEGAGYVRSDAADSVTGTLTFTVDQVLANAANLAGNDTGGTPRALVKVTGTDQVWVGNASLVTEIKGSAVNINGNTAWHAGNDGAGSGSDADTVDGIEGASLLRSDTADDVEGALTFNVSPVLPNLTPILGKDTGGSTRHLIQMSGTDDVLVGSPSNVLRLQGAGTPNYMGDTLWHAGNDGPGSGLDADTVDGVQAADLQQVVSEATNANTSSANASTGGVVVTTLDVGTVVAGQRIEITAHVQFDKGLTNGRCQAEIGKSAGDATVVCFANKAVAADYFYQESTSTYVRTITTTFRVTVGGSLTFYLNAYSFGSDATIPVNGGQLYARVLSK
jgi:hypothetical protein